MPTSSKQSEWLPSLSQITAFLFQNSQRYGIPWIVGGSDELQALLPNLTLQKKGESAHILISTFEHFMALYIETTPDQKINAFLFESQGFGWRFYPSRQIARILDAHFGEKLTLWISQTAWQPQDLQIGCVELSLEALKYFFESGNDLIKDLKTIPEDTHQKTDTPTISSLPKSVKLLTNGVMPKGLQQAFTDSFSKQFEPQCIWSDENTLSKAFLEKLHIKFEAHIKATSKKNNPNNDSQTLHVEQFQFYQGISDATRLLPIEEQVFYEFSWKQHSRELILQFHEEEAFLFGNSLIWAPNIRFPKTIKSNVTVLESAFFDTEEVKVKIDHEKYHLRFTVKNGSDHEKILIRYFQKTKSYEYLDTLVARGHKQPLSIQHASARALEILEIEKIKKYGLGIDVVNEGLKHYFKETENVYVPNCIFNTEDQKTQLIDEFLVLSSKYRYFLFSYAIRDTHQILIIFDNNLKTLTAIDSEKRVNKDFIKGIFNAACFSGYQIETPPPHSVQKDDHSCGIHVFLNAAHHLSEETKRPITPNLFLLMKYLLRLDQRTIGNIPSKLFSNREKAFFSDLKEQLGSRTDIPKLQLLSELIDRVSEETQHPISTLLKICIEDSENSKNTEHSLLIKRFLYILAAYSYEPKYEDPYHRKDLLNQIFLGLEKINHSNPAEIETARSIIATSVNLEVASFHEISKRKICALSLMNPNLEENDFSQIKQFLPETPEEILLFFQIALSAEEFFTQETQETNKNLALESQKKHEASIADKKQKLVLEFSEKIKSHFPEDLTKLEKEALEQGIQELLTYPLNHLHFFSDQEWSEFLLNYVRIFQGSSKIFVTKNMELFLAHREKFTPRKILLKTITHFCFDFDLLARTLPCFKGEEQEILVNEKKALINSLEKIEKTFSLINSHRLESGLINNYLTFSKKIKAQETGNNSTEYGIKKISHPLHLCFAFSLTTKKEERENLIKHHGNLICRFSIVHCILSDGNFHTPEADQFINTHIEKISSLDDLKKILTLGILSEDFEDRLLDKYAPLIKSTNEIFELASALKKQALKNKFIMQKISLFSSAKEIAYAAKHLSASAQKELIRETHHLILNFSEVKKIFFNLDESLKSDFIKMNLSKPTDPVSVKELIGFLLEEIQTMLLEQIDFSHWSWGDVFFTAQKILSHPVRDKLIFSQIEKISDSTELHWALSIISEENEELLISKKPDLITCWEDFYKILPAIKNQTLQNQLTLENHKYANTLKRLSDLIKHLPNNAETILKIILEAHKNLIEDWEDISEILDVIDDAFLGIMFEQSLESIKTFEELIDSFNYFQDAEHQKNLIEKKSYLISSWENLSKLLKKLISPKLKDQLIIEHIEKASESERIQAMEWLSIEARQKVFSKTSNSNPISFSTLGHTTLFEPNEPSNNSRLSETFSIK